MSNRRNIIYMIVGVVVLVLLHIYLSLGGASNLTRRETVLDKKMLAADAISIERSGGQRVELKKTDDGWSILSPYSADADESAVEKMLDFLVVCKIEERNTYTEKELAKCNLRRSDLGLDNPAVKVRVSKGGASETVLVGNRVSTTNEVYAVIGDDSCVYLLDSRILGLVDVPSETFRSRKLIVRESLPIAMFDIKRPDGRLLRMRKSDGQWMCCGDSVTGRYEPASNLRIDEFLACLDKSGAEDFVWPVGAAGEPSLVTVPMLAGYGLDTEGGVAITVRDKGLPPNQVVLGNDAGDGLVYALVQNAKAIVRVDKRLKDLAISKDFSDSRIFPYEASRVSRISFFDGGVDYRLAKTGEGKWIMDSPVSANADEEGVKKLLERILAATTNDRDSDGIMVSLSTNSPSEKISRSVLLSDFSPAMLRSREIARFDTSDIRRIVSGSEGIVSSVICDRDKQVWVSDSSSAGSVVRQEAVDGILSKLKSLNAQSIVTLKATEGELKFFGLDKPFCTISIDFFKENSLRRNIFIGERTEQGYYATMGASFDAVFILSFADAAILTSPLTTEHGSEKGTK
ncbi:MAG: DUF4340 domain-containing protein [Kiritimatiellae bacterium]|nr:DUF4340 domain-containing protein [Kiritimatiellia bacterium]MBO7237159.1 DUF4340 domain-containing protein [Kiritimatiellia bacterium]